MLERLKRFVDRRTTVAVRECRHCGTTVDRTASGCPTCDSGEITCYRV